MADWDVGIENLQEIAKALALGLFPEPMKVLERLHVAFEIVVERDAVETQVGPERALLGSAVEVAALDVVDAGGAERPCGLRGVAGPPGQVDVGGIVGANRGSDRRTIEEPLAKRQRMVRAGRHEHDVDEPLTGDQPHLLAVLLERLEPDLAGMHLGRLARRASPSAMSASLASARMNSRQFASAWIAASLRSSDLIISATSACLALAQTRDGDA